MSFASDRAPDLSIIVCTYNRQKHILNCLESLKKQEADPSVFEVIVVNDGSSDQTDQTVREFMKNTGSLQFRYESYQPNKGLSFARNHGFRISRGRFISYVDDDAVMPPFFAARVIRNFEINPAYQAMGGAIIPLYSHGEQEPAWMSSYIWGIVSKVDYGTSYTTFPPGKYPSGCNMLFRREILETIGGFDPGLRIRSDDKYIFGKLREHGIRSILFCPDIPVRHHIDDERITRDGVVRVSLSVGRSERIRIGRNPLAQSGKFMEYILKLAASVLLGLRFIFQGTPLKGGYLILVRWKVMTGYFSG